VEHRRSKDDGKVYRVYLAPSRDESLWRSEPERADFIRANVDKWEIEWLDRASKKL
jgi:hypothetical protein